MSFLSLLDGWIALPIKHEQIVMRISGEVGCQSTVLLCADCHRAGGRELFYTGRDKRLPVCQIPGPHRIVLIVPDCEQQPFAGNLLLDQRISPGDGSSQAAIVCDRDGTDRIAMPLEPPGYP